MVNDQLIRIHHMRLLQYDNMMTKQLQEQRDRDARPPDSPTSSSDPTLSNIQPKLLSSSAPPGTSLLGQHSFSTTAVSRHDSPSPLKDKKHKHRIRNSSISKSQSFTPVSKGYNGGQNKDDHSYSGLVVGHSEKNQGSHHHHQTSAKKKSSWRHLLSPSYKSRSDEFHKFFADDIPGDERLIADYSCALHREILIQGRVYISINYIAFYSNLFSWITKLVVRLRDIADIYKANTARIIPNAIQIVTNASEKHVFASFIARDKSYIMFWRIWRNNLLQERMTVEEIRSLVHLSYGKDLGMNNDEELEINSPDPAKTLAGGKERVEDEGQTTSERSETIAPNPMDGNNNSSENNEDENVNHLANQKPVIGDRDANNCDNSSRSRLDSVAGGGGHCNDEDSKTVTEDADQGARDDHQAGVLEKLTHGMHDGAHESRSDQDMPEESGSPWSDISACSPTTTSSAVVVDTPVINLSHETTSSLGGYKEHGQPDEWDGPEFETSPREVGDPIRMLKRDRLETDHVNVVGSLSSETTIKLSVEDSLANNHADVCDDWQDPEAPPEKPVDEDQTTVDTQMGGELSSELADLNTVCDCEDHQGLLIADEEFDINVDTLFSLIFTNSKFMRAYMIRRGMTDTVVSKWKRSAAASASSGSIASANNSSSCGEKSNSSTLSRSTTTRDDRSRRNSIDSFNIHLARPSAVKTKQVRQLNYSINLNHVWAKQIQVEERQIICLTKPGVYVLKSQTINSGVPCSEAFTVDMTYCLTRTSNLSKSRMVVHGGVNFIKDKHNWKLAMVKSVIEKQSVQGINDFVGNLITCIREYIDKKKKQQQQQPASDICLERDDEQDGNDTSLLQDDDQMGGTARSNDSGHAAAPSSCATNTECNQHHRVAATRHSRGASLRSQGRSRTNGKRALVNRNCSSPANMFDGSRSSRSLVREKSKLKERKLRNMYKYYIHAAAVNQDGEECSRQEGDRNQRETASCFEHAHLGSSSDGDSLASSDRESFEDNGSMIMMMAAHETDSSQVSEGRAYGRGRGQSFSDLESGGGRSMDEIDDDNEDEVGDGNEHDADFDQRRRSNASETSNITINNGNIGYRRRSRAAATASRRQTNEAGDELRASSRGRYSSKNEAAGGCRTAAAHQRRHRTRSPLFQRPLPDCNTGSRARLLKGLFSNKNLVIFSLVLIILLLSSLVTMNVVLLRRLENIENRLMSDCALDAPPSKSGAGDSNAKNLSNISSNIGTRPQV